MALTPPFTVRIEAPGTSFGDTMNEIRTWLDHRKIQPALFMPVGNAGVGFSIAFNTENEARLFEREFAGLLRAGVQALS